MKPARILLAALVCGLLASQAAAFDLSFDLGVSDRAWYRYRNETGPRLTGNVTLGTRIGDSFYINGNFWNSSQLGLTATDWVVPREQDIGLDLGYTSEFVDAGIFSTLYAIGGRTRVDLGALVSAGVPVVGDLVSLNASLRAITDFLGFYAEARLGPSIFLPLELPLEIGVQASAGFLAGAYDGIVYNGFSHLALQPKLTAYLGKYFSLSVLGGYCFDLSGGLFPGYPFVGGLIGASLGSAD